MAFEIGEKGGRPERRALEDWKLAERHWPRGDFRRLRCRRPVSSRLRVLKPSPDSKGVLRNTSRSGPDDDRRPRMRPLRGSWRRPGGRTRHLAGKLSRRPRRRSSSRSGGKPGNRPSRRSFSPRAGVFRRGRSQGPGRRRVPASAGDSAPVDRPSLGQLSGRADVLHHGEVPIIERPCRRARAAVQQGAPSYECHDPPVPKDDCNVVPPVLRTLTRSGFSLQTCQCPFRVRSLLGRFVPCSKRTRREGVRSPTRDWYAPRWSLRCP
jgi:hypothetical protein